MLNKLNPLITGENLEIYDDPFEHVIIDNFFETVVAEGLLDDFEPFHSDIWHVYSNQIELKKTCNNWNVFPPLTYSIFQLLNSQNFIDQISKLFSIKNLFSDYGLNGGGWHIHGNGGKLNPHLDYSIHPKLELQRRLNLIVYLSKDWTENMGGHFGLWSKDEDGQPKRLVKEILPKFNRGIIFSTKESWHGLASNVKCDENVFRRSIATFYLSEAEKNSDRRGKALFAPTSEQKGDKDVEELIRLRANVKTASTVYKK